MSIVTVKISIITAILAVVAALCAIAFDSQQAEAKGRWNLTGSDSQHSQVTHQDEQPALNFLWASADDDYVPTATASHSFGTFLSNVVKAIIPSMMPNTSAPHGQVTCTLSDGHGGTFTVTRDSCADL